MLLGFGWAVIQASRERLVGVDGPDVDDMDKALDREDRALHTACRDWLEKHERSLLKWMFSEGLNNHCGLLQFHTSQNHRTSELWDLAAFIASQSKGSFGVLHVHDDEDNGARAGHDFTRTFRVWRILDGQVTEHPDPLFSPFASPHAFGGENDFGK